MFLNSMLLLLLFKTVVFLGTDIFKSNSSIFVDNFFELYNDLFYDIPKEGENDSHQFLIAQSTEYAGVGNSEEIEALITEIDNLRAQLLEANEKILELTEQNVASTQTEIDSTLSRTNTNIPGVNVASSPASTY